ncbi:MAG: DMT family transporter [Bacteroidota bacterium]
MKRPLSRSLLEIHLATLMFGVAGLFGKWLDIPAEWIVLGRAALAAGFLCVLMKLWKESIRLPEGKHGRVFIGLGMLLAFHWVAFFRGIQLSTVAIGLLTYGAFPLFTTFLEPLILKEKWRMDQLLLSILTLFGLYLVIPDFDFQNSYTQGAIWGLASGASFALLTVVNRSQVQQYPSRLIAFYQNSFAALTLLPFLWIKTGVMTLQDWGLLVLLGIVFTGISHTLFIQAMKNIRASTASIISNVEPVYGILAALILLQEIPDSRTILGGILIITASIAATVRR